MTESKKRGPRPDVAERNKSAEHKAKVKAAWTPEKRMTQRERMRGYWDRIKSSTSPKAGG